MQLFSFFISSNFTFSLMNIIWQSICFLYLIKFLLPAATSGSWQIYLNQILVFPLKQSICLFHCNRLPTFSRKVESPEVRQEKLRQLYVFYTAKRVNLFDNSIIQKKMFDRFSKSWYINEASPQNDLFRKYLAMAILIVCIFVVAFLSCCFYCFYFSISRRSNSISKATAEKLNVSKSKYN